MRGKPTTLLPGDRYGRLTVVSVDPEIRGDNTRRWLCQCDCGGTTLQSSYALASGRVSSCGCWRREWVSARNTKHGLSYKVPEYDVWKGMLARCDDPNHISYPWYGGCGVTVCERWRAFENFYADMGPRPTPKHQIDRIDSTSGYGPTNCRWASKKEQARNQTNNHLLTFNGETLPIAAWADRLGISSSVINQRLRKLRWTVERALTEPVHSGKSCNVNQNATATSSRWLR